MTQPQPHQRPQLPPIPPRPVPATAGRRLVVATGLLQITVGLCAGLALAQLAMLTALGMCPQRQQTSAPVRPARPSGTGPFALVP